MPTMGRYCKAYLIGTLREFKGWYENTEAIKKVKETIDGKEIEKPRTLTDDDYLFVQENFTVTDGIFLDENIVYNKISPEWQQFCEQTLRFKAPLDELGELEAE